MLLVIAYITASSASIKQKPSAQIIHVTNDNKYGKVVQYVDSHSSHFQSYWSLKLLTLCLSPLLSSNFISDSSLAHLCCNMLHDFSLSVMLSLSHWLFEPVLSHYTTTVLNNSEVTTLQLQRCLMILCWKHINYACIEEWKLRLALTSLHMNNQRYLFFLI